MLRRILSAALLSCVVLCIQGQQALDPQTVQSNLRKLLETKLDAEGQKVDPASVKDKMLLVAFSGDPNDEALTMFRKTMPVVKTKVESVAVIRVSHLPESTKATRERPDFNIGTDSYHTPSNLIEISKDFFKSKGYSLGIDWPYKGSIVPLEHYQKDKDVQTIMLEINRSLYLKESTNEKSEKYSEIKQITSEFIKEIRESL